VAERVGWYVPVKVGVGVAGVRVKLVSVAVAEKGEGVAVTVIVSLRLEDHVCVGLRREGVLVMVVVKVWLTVGLDRLPLRVQVGLCVRLKVDMVGVRLGLFHVAVGGEGVLVSVQDRVWVRVWGDRVGVLVKVLVTVHDSVTVLLGGAAGGDLVGVGDSVKVLVQLRHVVTLWLSDMVEAVPQERVGVLVVVRFRLSVCVGVTDSPEGVGVNEVSVTVRVAWDRVRGRDTVSAGVSV